MSIWSDLRSFWTGDEEEQVRKDSPVSVSTPPKAEEPPATQAEPSRPKERTVTKDGPVYAGESAYESMKKDHPGEAMIREAEESTADQIARREQSRGETELDRRIEGTLTGGVKGYAASLLDALGTTAEGLDSIFPGSDYTAGGNDRKDAWLVTPNAYDDALRNSGDALRDLQSAAQWLHDSGEADIAAAKDGLGTVGQFMVDLGAEGVKRFGDAAVNAAIPGAGIYMLGTRTFGDASRQAREDGADIGGQILYGAGRTLTATQIEKLFDGLNGMYGSGRVDDKIISLVKEYVGNEKLQNLAKAAIDDIGEGAVESVATDIADQMLKSIYNGQDSIQNAYEAEWGGIMRNVLINTIIGILSGDSGVQKNNNK